MSKDVLMTHQVVGFDWTRWKGEIIGGLSTFFAMAYCIAVVPASLVQSGLQPSFSIAYTGTVLLIFASSLCMGLFARSPFVVAPSLGVHLFFIQQVALRHELSWATACGILCWSGLAVMAFWFFPQARKIYSFLPGSVRLGISIGVSLFLIQIGLQNVGLFSLAPVDWFKTETLFVLFHLVIALCLMPYTSGAFLLAVLGTTALGFLGGNLTSPSESFSTPSFEGLGVIDWWGSLAYPVLILNIALNNLLDGSTSLIAMSQVANKMTPEGEPQNLRSSMTSNAFGTFLSGILGSTPTTIYFESLAGIKVGARTGVAAVLAALCFIPCLFLAPWVQTIPAYASSPVLILIGALLLKTDLPRFVKEAPLHGIERLAMLAPIIAIPLTFSVTQGALLGIAIYHLAHAVGGDRKKVSWPLLLICFSLWLFVFLSQSFS